LTSKRQNDTFPAFPEIRIKQKEQNQAPGSLARHYGFFGQGGGWAAADEDKESIQPSGSEIVDEFGQRF